MPKYTVLLEVNVPGVGGASSAQTNVNAPTPEAAIAEAMKGITIECTSVVKTGA